MSGLERVVVAHKEGDFGDAGDVFWAQPRPSPSGSLLSAAPCAPALRLYLAQLLLAAVCGSLALRSAVRR